MHVDMHTDKDEDRKVEAEVRDFNSFHVLRLNYYPDVFTLYVESPAVLLPIARAILEANNLEMPEMPEIEDEDDN